MRQDHVDGRDRSSLSELPRFSSFLSPHDQMHNQMKALLVCLLSSFLLIAFLFKRKKMNAVRNGFPPRPNPPPVGSGSSASGLTKRQCRRRKEKRYRLRKASPYLVVLVASHYLLPWTSFALVDAVYVSHGDLRRGLLLFLSIQQLLHIAQLTHSRRSIFFPQSLTSQTFED